MPIDINTPRHNDTRARLTLIQGGRKSTACPPVVTEVVTPPAGKSAANEYARFERGIFESFEPVGFEEQLLATSLAHCMWRQQQVRDQQSRLCEEGVPPGASEQQVAEANLKTFMTHSRYFANMSRYEDRMTTLMYSYMRRLIRAQRQRQASQKRARKEACLILRHGIAEGNSPDPQREVEQNGFVFSVGELLSDITREQLLKSTRASAKRNRHPKAS